MRFSLLTLLLSASVASAADAGKPNVILIVADDLGCFELGCYGQKKIRTPAIDAIAAKGMRLTQFYAGNAVCAPSRCCLMTGKHSGHATVRNNKEVRPEGQHPIRADDVTVATLLKNNGYATGAIGKWGLGPFGSTGDPFRHGIEFFFGYNCQRHAHSHYPTFLYRNDKRFDLPGNDLAQGPTHSHDLFEAETLAFLDANKAKPFFLYLPYTIPHVAVQVPEDSLNEYKGKLGDDPAYDGKKGYRPHPAPHAGYAAMVTRMDRTVGRVVDKLKELKIDGNTLILFTSDNGPTHNVGGADSTFFESAGPLRGLKGSLYEGGIRVPLVAAWPGVIEPGTTCDTPFAFWDVLPTLCDVTTTKTPEGLDGLSMKRTLLGAGGQPTHDALYWEFSGYGGQQAVRKGNWKAVRQALGQGKVTTELYDLATDPGEATDVAAKHPDVVAAMGAIFKREHIRSPDFPLPAIDPSSKPKP
jgi:arylsulfatase A